MLKWFEGFTRAEWRVLNISFVMMMACAFLLSNDRMMRKLTMPRDFQLGQILGQALDVSGDARMKSGQEDWRVLEGPLQLGDTAATGQDGRALIKAKPGIEFQFNPNSVFRVALVEGVPVFDLLDGRFLWKVDGEIEVAVRGERALLSGNQATVEIELSTESVEPKVKIASGRGTFQLRHGRADESDSQGPIAAPMPNETYFYVWRLHDLYRITGRKVESKPVPSMVPLDVIVNWEHPVATGPFSLQLSSAAEFTEQGKFFPSSDQTLTLDQVFLGENFWRVSFRDMYWSETRHFKVAPRYWDMALKPEQSEVTARAESIVSVRWLPSEKAVGYLSEVDGVLEWTSEPEVKIATHGPRVKSARIRAVNSRNEISDWSTPIKITVE